MFKFKKLLTTSMTSKGVVISINISKKKGEQKSPVAYANITEIGLEGDAHAGDWHRQISLLAEHSIEKMRGKGIEIKHGDFAENITVGGITLSNVTIGQKIQIGNSVLLEITQIGKECHESCLIRQTVGDCVMPREGIFGKVITGGAIRVQDKIILL
ncbi:MAG: MOSC domain-containing protein [Candidatus Thermoplasmatota archaeon]|jgi:MOSC domain-containing protein YiiM|nr:MOSC domain-containing protein [Candidatus Thermoplasmatota archaeon]